MTLAVRLHEAINNTNVLTNPTDRIKEYFAHHPEVFKVALLANHVFRAATMAAFMMLTPLPLSISMGICLAGSLFYRLTVESNCAYKFALPALAGAAAFMIGKTSLANLISGVALASIEAFTMACAPLIPLGIYSVYVILTVSYDVDNRPCPFCPTE